MDWRLMARRGLVSGFLVLHISAVLAYVMPDCPIRRQTFNIASYYMFPLGLWQSWAMFAPNPARESLALEAEIIDSKGMRHLHQFVNLADYSWYEAFPRYRHFKFAYNVSLDEFAAARKFVARHAARTLGLKDEAYPIHVGLFYQVGMPPPEGIAMRDPMTPKRAQMVDAFEFASRKEVEP